MIPSPPFSAGAPHSLPIPQISMAPQPTAPRPIGSLQGLLPLTCAAGVEATAAPDRDYLLKEIRFYDGDFQAATVSITIGNQQLFNGQAVRLGLLQSEFTNGQDLVADDVLITFRLPQTVPVARNMPVRITCSVATNVLIVCVDPAAL